MWPANVLELLTVLTDTQKYNELWHFVLRWVCATSCLPIAESRLEFAFPNAWVSKFCNLGRQGILWKPRNAGGYPTPTRQTFFS
jgi:hypothetical protein